MLRPAKSALLRTILETVPDAMVVIDERGTVQYFSSAAERLFGYTAAEVRGQNVKMLMPAPYREQHDGYLRRYLTHRRAANHRHRPCRGRPAQGRQSTFPMELSVGEAPGERMFTGFVRDLTERQQTERRLHELQDGLLHVSRLRAMGQMAAALAHELNQPLTATANYVRAALRLLDATEPNLERARQAMRHAAEQTLRSGEIIRRLRELRCPRRAVAPAGECRSAGRGGLCTGAGRRQGARHNGAHQRAARPGRTVGGPGANSAGAAQSDPQRHGCDGNERGPRTASERIAAAAATC